MEWHHVIDPEGPELDRLAERYKLHPLHIEDCRHRDQRAKLEEGHGYLFTVLKPIRMKESGDFAALDMDVFLGADFVITVEETGCPEVRELITRVKRVLPAGARPDQVYHRVMDELVDSYLPLLDKLHNTIDEIEDQALDAATPEVLQSIFRVKRTLVFLRGILANTRDLISQLQRLNVQWISPELAPYFRDVFDHVARNLDMVEIMRDLLAGSLEVYLSSVANRTNQVMKVLTVLSTIALPALVISGFYGMNVKGLPGADSSHGVGIAVVLMAGVTVVLLWVLRRFGWL